MPTLYVGFDVFFPSVYDATVNGPRGHFYIVLQPVISEMDGADRIALQQYFNYTGSDIGTTIDVKPLTVDVANRLNAAKAATLAPFPPETTIQFKEISWDGLTAPIQIPSNGAPRFIGGAATTDHQMVSPLLLDRGQWPHFAVTNKASPLIGSWELLDKKIQQPTALAWVTAVVGKIAHMKNVEGKTLSATESKVFDLMTAAGLGQEPALSDAKMRDALTAGPNPYAARIYDFLVNAKDQNYQPQSFSYGEEALVASLNPGPSPLFEGFEDIENASHHIVSLSYHTRLWRLLKDKINEPSDTPGQPPKGPDQVRLALKRMFGFGEPLFWPSPNDETFMLCGLPDLKGWVCTNAHSLLGHAFGFDLPLNGKLKNFSVDLEIQGRAVSAIPLVNGPAPDGANRTGMLEGAQNALVDWFAATPPKTISVGLGADPDAIFGRGFFLFQPKIAKCTKDTFPDAGKIAYAVPTALLDAVDPAARWDQPRGGAPGVQMTIATPPRAGLLRSEIYLGQSVLPDGSGDYAPYLRLRVALTRVNSSFANPAAYELTLATRPSPAEQAALMDLFNHFADFYVGLSPTKPPPTLVIVPASGGPPTKWPISADRLLKPAVAPPPLTLVLADDATQSLAALLRPPPPSPNPSGVTTLPPDPSHATCDLLLILDPSATDKTPFNLLVCDSTAGDPAPLIALNRVFTSRLSRSTDRLQERVAVSLSPWPADPKSADEYVASHLTNFNLLRMSLTTTDATVVALTPTDDPDEAAVIPGTPKKALFNLTLNDALIPLPRPLAPSPLPPWKAGWVQNNAPPQFGYFLSHIFSQNMRNPVQTEALRYVNYLTPEIEWNLEGTVAHQYGMALAVIEKSAVTLPLTTDISHPGLTARRDTKAGANPEDNPHRALITWKMSPDNPGLVRLLFSSEFLRFVETDSTDAGTNGTGVGNGSDSVGALSQSPARYRAIYEPLADFLRCLDNSDVVTAGQGTRSVPGVTLRMEGWVFDGAAAADARLDPNGPTNDPPATVINNMRMLGAAEVVLTPAFLEGIASNTPQIQSLRDLLQQPFTKFTQQVHGLAGGNRDWATLDVPAGTWSADGANLDAQGLFANSDLVRLGMQLIRPKADVANNPNPMFPGFSHDVKAEIQKQLFGKKDFSDLEASAADELARYLDDGPNAKTVLRNRFAWLRPDDGGLSSVKTGSTDSGGSQTSQKTSSLVATLVGDVAPFVTQRAKPAPPADTVLTLYYVPVAFRPLAPHALVGDTGAVEEFAAFLLGVVADIMAGRKPKDVQLLGMGGVGDSYDLRARVLELYWDQTGVMNTVVSQLKTLIDYVEWNDIENTKMQWVRAQANATLGDADGGWLRAIGVLLDQSPNLYADAQGFAVALVDRTQGRDSWDDALMALQVTKSVPNIAVQTTSTVPSNPIVDQVVFTRVHGRRTVPFFIDTFDTARYGDTFWIDRNSYTPITPGGNIGQPVKFSEGWALSSRGDTEARTADDYLRGRNVFDNSRVAGLTNSSRRSLEAEVVPYNTVWQNSGGPSLPGNRGVYLLPARQFPDAPTVMIPVATSTDESGTPVWRTSMDLTLAAGTAPDLTALYWDALSSQVMTAPVTFAGSTAGTKITASNPQHQYPASQPADDRVPDGWWCLDTYATHHHFQVAPDPADIPPFKNDMFRIEVEISPDPFLADPETPGATTPPKGDGLLGWFQYKRFIDHDRSTRQPQPSSNDWPAAIAHDQFVDQLRLWLSSTEDASDWTKTGLLRPLKAGRVPFPGSNTVTFLYTPIPAGGAPPSLLKQSGGGSDIGDVIAVDMLSITSNQEGWVLRVIVLDQAWSYTRVRVALLRNENTSDGKLEFSPEFAMESPPSAWSAFGREPVAVDFTSQQMQTRNLPRAISVLRAGMSVSAYVNWSGSSLPSYGQAISTACRATFLSASGAACKMWNSTALANPHYTVRGTVLQERLDLHARFRLIAGRTVPAGAELARNEDIPRQFLPTANTVTADKVDDLVKAIRNDLVPGIHQKIQTIWYNPKDEEVVRVTWPVGFDA